MHTATKRFLVITFVGLMSAQSALFCAQETWQQPLLRPRQETATPEKPKSLVIDGDQVEINATGKNKRRQKGSSPSLGRKVLRWIGYTMLGAVTACVISLCLLIVLVPASYLPLFPLIALVYLAIPATPFLLFLLIDSLLSKD